VAWNSTTVDEQHQSRGQRHRHQDVETVKKAQLGIFGEIRYGLPVDAECTRRHEPAHVALPETVLQRRMQV
jgi:hypothetical protein